MRRTFLSLQYLRGLAALLVVVAHTTEYPFQAGTSVPWWTARTGGMGVTTFFVISGFIITVVAGPGRFDPAVFAWRRLLRVVPLYWVCTIFVFAMALAAPALFKTTTADPSHFVLSLLFVPHPAPGDGTNYWSPLHKPGWTLNFEMFFYALTASLFWCSTGRTRALILSLILAIFVALSFGEVRSMGVLGFYASKDLIGFMTGIWLAEAEAALPTRFRPSRGACVLAGCLTGLVVLSVYLAPTEEATRYPALVAGAALVAFGLVLERGAMLPRMRGLGTIGDASYSLYLTHMFSVGVAWPVARRLVGADSTLLLPAGVLASTIVAVLVALVSYRVIERPFIRLSHRLIWRRAAAPAPQATAA